MRSILSLYAIDQAALDALSSELRAALVADDHAALTKLLGLGEALAARLASRPAVEWMVRTDDDEQAGPFFASMRRIAKKRVLELAWTSKHASLEGRLRAYDVVRDDKAVAAAIDRCLEPARVPFFFGRKGATMGLVTDSDRALLAEAIGPDGTLRGGRAEDALPDELALFGDALAEHEGTLLLHDALEV